MANKHKCIRIQINTVDKASTWVNLDLVSKAGASLCISLVCLAFISRETKDKFPLNSGKQGEREFL